MKILLMTAGSRGDVEPFAALARRAADAGHVVRLAAPDNHGVRIDGIDVVSLGADFGALIQSQGVSLGAAVRNYRTAVRPTMRSIVVGAARRAVEFGPDVVVWHPKVLSAPLIADAMGIPHVLAETVPTVTPTRAFPAAGIVAHDLGPLNRLTYLLAAGAARAFRRELGEAATVLGMRRPPRTSRPAATLLPISPQLLPRPRDWPDNVHLTGAWRSEDVAGALPSAVSEFIAAGPFVYAGFGSMASGDPFARGRALIEGARRRGLRVLVSTGLGGIAVPDDLRAGDVLSVPTVAHGAILPHAVAAVHHGGAGTVHAAVGAGTVSIIVPFIADQPFWGALLARTGLGPPPLPRRKLTPDRVEHALQAVPAFRSAIADASDRMRTEDGTGKALHVLEHL
jgi:sterol 3beta-glucosyltransferase